MQMEESGHRNEGLVHGGVVVVVVAAGSRNIMHTPKWSKTVVRNKTLVLKMDTERNIANNNFFYIFLSTKCLNKTILAINLSSTL